MDEVFGSLPYVGITGFVHPDEPVDLIKAIRGLSDSDPDLPACGQILFGVGRHFYRLQIGVLVSGKTLRGQQNKWPYRYPHPDYLHELLYAANWMKANVESPMFPVIHFNSDDSSRLIFEMQYLEERTHCYPLNFQMNFCWPAPDDLVYFSKYEKRRLILQIGRRALDQIEWKPELLRGRLMGLYEASISDILLDPSGGVGLQVDFDRLRPLIEVVRNTMPKIGVGVAGGLSADNVERLLPLFRDYPGLSIDAENNLRQPRDNPHRNLLDIDAAANYVNMAAKTIRQAGCE